ncbi:MAG: tripartite tricarboxylate transporter substrate binding protein [Burkholderiales bacterium]|nr:tripartite tricarboxylate transporter substrate binding protein [Burkholderiales bacterium]
MTKLMLCAIAVAFAGAAGTAGAQAWSPQKNVEIVAGSAPGGSNDKTARTMERIFTANKLAPVPLIVINKPGGGGSIAYTYVSQKPGDAHSLYIASSGLLSNNILGSSKLGHRDFTPVASLYEDYAVFMVRTESPIKSGRELAERLKKDPRSVVVGFANAFGSSRHVASGLLIKSLGGNARDLKPVVFKGSAEAITAMLGGHIDVAVAGAVNAVAHVNNGTVRVIGVAAPERLTGTLAGTPTWKEQGADFVYGNWRATFGPRGLTAAQVSFWEDALRKMAQAPEWKDDLEKNYWSDNFAGSAQLAKDLETDYAYLKTVLQDLGLAR